MTLVALLKQMGYPQLPALESSLLATAATATPADDPLLALPVLHFALLDYNAALTAKFATGGYRFYSKSDLAFVRSAFRACRDELKFFPRLTVEQFLRWGFAQQRLLLLCEVLRKCIAEARKLKRAGASRAGKVGVATMKRAVTKKRATATETAGVARSDDTASFVRRARAAAKSGRLPRSSGAPPPGVPTQRRRAAAASATAIAAPPAATLDALDALRDALMVSLLYLIYSYRYCTFRAIPAHNLTRSP